MILAAGRGERMMPLTANCPKPMLEVAGLPLLGHHINKLKAVGITDIVINHAWCGDKITQHFGDGSQFGVTIRYSDESTGALETAGGISKALPMLVSNTDNGTLDDSPFLVVNGDIFTDFDFANLPKLADDCLAHTFLVTNPEHNLSGDFICERNKLINKGDIPSEQSLTHTFSGIALYRPSFFVSLERENSELVKTALGPMLRNGAEQGTISATVLNDYWADIGTPERLAQINQRQVKIQSDNS